MKETEWFSRLESALGAINENEKKKVVEYYREIYLDKMELGVEEEKALEEFGAPEEIAEQTLKEFGLKRDTDSAGKINGGTFSSQNRNTDANKEKNSSERLSRDCERRSGSNNTDKKETKNEIAFSDMTLGKLIAKFFLFLPYVICLIVLSSLWIALAATCLGCTIGGVGAFVKAFVELAITHSVTALFASIGVSLFTIGLGLVLIPASCKFALFIFRYTVKYFKF